MICPLTSIADEDRNGNVYRPFATEDAVGKRLVGELTDDPAKLKAYATVAHGRIYIYSNFKSAQGFSTKIYTIRNDVDLMKLAFNPVNPKGIDEDAFRAAFPRMTFLLDERLKADARFGRLDVAGASTRTVPAYAAAEVVARIDGGRIAVAAPGQAPVPLQGLTRAIAGNGGRLPGSLAGLEGRTWLIDTSGLEDGSIDEITKLLAQADRALRTAGGPGIHPVYTWNPRRARERMLSPIDGGRVVVRNDDSLLRADLGVIARRIIARKATAPSDGTRVQFTVGHFDPNDDPLSRIGGRAGERGQPRFHVLGLCNPGQTRAFLGFARAAMDAGDLGVLMPSREVDIPAMALVADVIHDPEWSNDGSLHLVGVAPLAIREQLQKAAEVARMKFLSCLRGAETEAQLRANIRKAYGEDADDVIKMFQGAGGGLDADRIKRTLDALEAGFKDFIHVSDLGTTRTSGDTHRIAA